MGPLRLLAFSVLGYLVLVKAANSQGETAASELSPLVQGRRKLPAQAQKSQAPSVQASFHDLLDSLRALFTRSLDSLRRGEGTASEFFKEAMALAEEREALALGLHNYKATLDTGLGPEAEKEFKKLIREDVEQYKSLITRSFLLFLNAAGVPRDEAEKALETQPGLAALLSFLHRSAVAEFVPYL